VSVQGSEGGREGLPFDGAGEAEVAQFGDGLIPAFFYDL